MLLLWFSNIIDPISIDLDASEHYESDDEPETLQPVSTEIAVTLYGKAFTTLNRSNFNFNDMYEDFLHAIDKLLAAKTKQPIEVIETADRIVTWKWYTVAKSQQVKQPISNAFESEDHYHQMQADILNTSHKNPTFSNMVMHICINIVKALEDGETESIPILAPAGRMVISSSSFANWSVRQYVNRKLLPSVQWRPGI